MKSMNITVIGCGRWGSFIAKYLFDIGHSVTLYGRQNSDHMQAFLQHRRNQFLTLPEGLALSTDLSHALEGAALAVISVGSQNLRQVASDLKKTGWQGTVVLCMKGLEITSGKRLSVVLQEELGDMPCAVWLGPGHVQDFCAGIPNCMVIDSENEEVKKGLVEAFSSSLIRFYYGNDLLGNEIGAASKNVIGIAAGLLDGIRHAPLKGALMSRGTREIARLIKAMGGKELSAYGLCHLGDYEATVFSLFSHNRRFGEAFAKGETFTELAEGYYTVRALMQLSVQYGVELPICQTVENILYKGAPVKESLFALFERRLKSEF